jgi:hypothetical protein
MFHEIVDKAGDYLLTTFFLCLAVSLVSLTVWLVFSIIKSILTM